jgi:hypothetical protein
MPIDRLLKIRLSVAFVLAVALAIVVVVQAPKHLSDSAEVSEPNPVVAQIEDLEGFVQLLRPSKDPAAPLKQDLNIEEPLKHMDRLILKDQERIVFSAIPTSAESQDVFYKLEVTGPAELIFEKWNWQIKKTPLVLFLDLGENASYNVLTNGLRGDVYIISKNTMYAPESKKQKQIDELTINVNAPSSAVSNVDVADTPEIAKELPDKVSPAETAENKESGFIAQKLSEQRDEFIKCQGNAIRENQPAKGELLIGFLIQKNGKADEIKVLKSTVSNPSLEACVVSVVQRTTFLSVESGPRALEKIRTSFPLLFQ